MGRATAIVARAAADAPAQRTEFVYDEVGNVIEITDPLGGVTTQRFDAVNRRVERLLPNGVVSTWGYDERDRVIAVTHRGPDGEVLRSVAYERASGGEPTRITHEDGSSVELGYDDAFRLASEAYFDASGILLETVTYEHDAAGNRTRRVDGAGVEDYVYGVGYRLVGTSGPGGETSFGFDADGRVVSLTRNGAERQLTYSAFDQLSSLREGGEEVASYGYDALYRQTRTASGGTTRHVLVAPVVGDALESPLLISDGSGELLGAFVHVDGVPLMRVGPDGPVYYLADAMGSVIGLADEAGERVAALRYDGFGNALLEDGAAAALTAELGGDFRFHGGWLDSATGLYRFRARYYDPRTGRFLSRDPADISIRLPETMNGYPYGFSNPHVYKDPTGLFTVSEVNVTVSVDNVLQAIKGNVSRYAIDEGKQAVAEIVVDFLTSLL